MVGCRLPESALEENLCNLTSTWLIINHIQARGTIFSGEAWGLRAELLGVPRDCSPEKSMNNWMVRGCNSQHGKISETRIHIYSLSVAISEGCTDQEKLHRRGTCRLNNPLGLNVAEMFSVTCRIFFPS